MSEVISRKEFVKKAAAAVGGVVAGVVFDKARVRRIENKRADKEVKAMGDLPHEVGELLYFSLLDGFNGRGHVSGNFSLEGSEGDIAIKYSPDEYWFFDPERFPVLYLHEDEEGGAFSLQRPRGKGHDDSAGEVEFGAFFSSAGSVHSLEELYAVIRLFHKQGYKNLQTILNIELPKSEEGGVYDTREDGLLELKKIFYPEVSRLGQLAGYHERVPVRIIRSWKNGEWHYFMPALIGAGE